MSSFSCSPTAQHLPHKCTSVGKEFTFSLSPAAICFQSLLLRDPHPSQAWLSPWDAYPLPAVSAKPPYPHLLSQRLGDTSRLYLPKGRHPQPHPKGTQLYPLGQTHLPQEPCPIYGNQDVKVLCALSRLPAPLAISHHVVAPGWARRHLQCETA